MSIIDLLGAKKEAEAFWAEVSNDVDSTERGRIIKAGEALVWAVLWRVLLKVGVPLGAVATIALTISASQITGETPPGVASEPSINVIAKEPGVAFDIKLFCDAPDTLVGKTPMTDAPAGGTRYIATRGTESINWADSPEGKNLSAVYYVTQPNGNQTGLPVEVTKPAADCLKKKAK